MASKRAPPSPTGTHDSDPNEDPKRSRQEEDNEVDQTTQAIESSNVSAPPEPSTDLFAVDAEDAAMPDQAPAPAVAPWKQKAPAQSDQAILGFRQAKSDKGFVKLDKTKILFEGEPFSCIRTQRYSLGTPLTQIINPSGAHNWDLHSNPISGPSKNVVVLAYHSLSFHTVLCNIALIGLTPANPLVLACSPTGPLILAVTVAFAARYIECYPEGIFVAQDTENAEKIQMEVYTKAANKPHPTKPQIAREVLKEIAVEGLKHYELRDLAQYLFPKSWPPGGAPLAFKRSTPAGAKVKPKMNKVKFS
jgi:hypothetical protein